MGTIVDLMESAGDDLFYQEGFKNMIEDHIPWLKKKAVALGYTAHQADAFNNDLYGLLAELGVPASHRWIVMRLNGLMDYTQFTRDMLELIIYDEDDMSALVSRYSLME